jgi:16S rRNA (guanine527-N7)-methyltransferase
MIERLRAVSGRDVSRETFEQLERFVALLLAENEKQNLISATTIDQLWERHIVDGAQLLSLVDPGGTWLDIGSGPGLPGLVLAILSSDPITLVEPRRRRVDFLEAVKAELGLDHVTVIGTAIARVGGRYDVITARAVAPLDVLLAMACPLSHPKASHAATKCLFLKGRKAQTELDEARRTWHGVFRLVPSQTSPDAAIVVAESVARRG